VRPMPIVVPWQFCATANHRLMPVIRWFKNKPKAMLITDPDYSVAKQGAEYHIRAQWKGQPMTVPVELVARCWFPDNRKRDASNLAKMLGDSLTGIVLEDDSQIHRETYERSGISKENPRVEITITPMEANDGQPKT
jgi:Holliday junction resolvase RusA-like endonuclease